MNTRNLPHYRKCPDLMRRLFSGLKNPEVSDEMQEEFLTAGDENTLE